MRIKASKRCIKSTEYTQYARKKFLQNIFLFSRSRAEEKRGNDREIEIHQAHPVLNKSRMFTKK